MNNNNSIITSSLKIILNGLYVFTTSIKKSLLWIIVLNRIIVYQKFRIYHQMNKMEI